MFDRIARRYDRMNRLMTFGRDRAWRRHVVQMASPPPEGHLLDVASGTGDIALEALRQVPGLTVTACDFSMEMMHAGRQKPGAGALGWCCADGLHLPFPDDSFDSVTSGFLIRNVADPMGAFRQQVRVAKPGGRVVCLDTSPPPSGLLGLMAKIHLCKIIPLLGQTIGGDADAYRYLPKTTQSFKSPEALAAMMKEIGLESVTFRRFMFGTIVVLAGSKPIRS
jgi:demethylmenaquinone methyltransferase/2-methoxy-6-polyprenyl-1,4-benzoquinol methylase